MANKSETQAHDDRLPEALMPFVVTRQYGSDVLSVTEAAARLKISRATVTPEPVGESDGAKGRARFGRSSVGIHGIAPD